MDEWDFKVDILAIQLPCEVITIVLSVNFHPRCLCCHLVWRERGCGTRNTPSASLWPRGRSGRSVCLMVRRKRREERGMQWQTTSSQSPSTCTAAPGEKKRSGSSTSCLSLGQEPRAVRAAGRAQVVTRHHECEKHHLCAHQHLHLLFFSLQKPHGVETPPKKVRRRCTTCLELRKPEPCWTTAPT